MTPTKMLLPPALLLTALLLTDASPARAEDNFDHRVCRLTAAKVDPVDRSVSPGPFKGQFYRNTSGELLAQSATELEADHSRAFGRKENGLFSAYARSFCNEQHVKLKSVAHGPNEWIITLWHSFWSCPTSAPSTDITYLMKGDGCAELLQPELWTQFRDELAAIALDNDDGAPGPSAPFRFEKLAPLPAAQVEEARSKSVQFERGGSEPLVCEPPAQRDAR